MTILKLMDFLMMKNCIFAYTYKINDLGINFYTELHTFTSEAVQLLHTGICQFEFLITWILRDTDILNIERSQ